MELKIGEVLEGKVKSLTKFGAFVVLPDGSTGMVHISEVARTFVNDIHEHLSEGQDVKVMVIGNENGKINLSIKRTLPQEPHKPRPQSDRPHSAPRPAMHTPAAPPQPKSFDDMLKQFMTESDSRMSSNKLYADHKTKTRRR